MTRRPLYRRARMIRVGLRADCELLARLQYDAPRNNYCWSLWLNVCGQGMEQIDGECSALGLRPPRTSFTASSLNSALKCRLSVFFIFFLLAS